MRDHHKLKAFQLADELALLVYRATRSFPREELFGLRAQMRRAAVSLTSNLAEGYGRHHWQEALQYARQARGSLLELVEQVRVCVDQAYGPPELHRRVRDEDGPNVLRLLNGYIAYLQRRAGGRE